ncbi:hypothetical protein [Clostridium botulinum]|uniref:hypothetical protein n=1 Tax=Clostridium botulinum TaxID=1491 RepID=UPI0006A72DC8|nr:hypothetical protein [Clostridium botulinum]KAI3350142.1 hypothetical protein CIT18_04495 [Clostridium botulinum]KOM88956.1 hypothetical protein ACP51_04280 [Clostridium botulinum]KOR63522.1 hypothetical protein ADT22_03065 [Clostridium botulinum]MCS6111538.1 hypothetical protein [Clostridium botulinum]NFE10958.1 hypothetical protein [Clostridium botulinum]
MLEFKMLNETIKECDDLIITRVSSENIYSVMLYNTTAITKLYENLKQYKRILILCEEVVVCVAKIIGKEDYEFEKYNEIWKNNTGAWNSIIKFTDVIYLGRTIKDIFGEKTTIKNIETVGYINNIDEFNLLKREIKTMYAYHIHSELSDMGLLK